MTLWISLGSTLAAWQSHLCVWRPQELADKKFQSLSTPRVNASNQVDGRKLFEIYRRFGSNACMADNGRDARFWEVWRRLSTGRLEAFQSCEHWLNEFRVFARDTNGQNYPGSQLSRPSSDEVLAAEYVEPVAPSKERAKATT